MNTHHTKSKGDLAVLKAQLDLYQQGFWVAIPLTENAPFDLIVSKAGISQTVQVKYITAREGVLKVPFVNSWSDTKGVHHTPIDKSQIDMFCVYCPATDQCYYFKPSAFPNMTQVSLRLTRAKNNQAKGILWAPDYLKAPVA